MQKTLLFTTLILCSTCKVFTQQISSFGNVDMIDSYYNPAFTAFQDEIRVATLYRHLSSNSQGWFDRWQEGIILAEIDVPKWNSGIGVKLQQQHDFISRSRTAELNYRYSFKLNDNAFLTLGVGGGYKDNLVKYSELVFLDEPEDLDLSLKTDLSLNTGIGFSWKKKLYIGASVIQVNRPHFGFLQYPIHFAVHGNYLFNFSEDFQLQPQILWLFHENLNAIRVSAKGYHKNRFWWMVSLGKNIQPTIGVGLRMWNHFDLGYGVGLYRNPGAQSFGGYLHEMVLTYRL